MEDEFLDIVGSENKEFECPGQEICPRMHRHADVVECPPDANAITKAAAPVLGIIKKCRHCGKAIILPNNVKASEPFPQITIRERTGV